MPRILSKPSCVSCPTYDKICKGFLFQHFGVQTSGLSSISPRRIRCFEGQQAPQRQKNTCDKEPQDKHWSYLMMFHDVSWCFMTYLLIFRAHIAFRWRRKQGHGRSWCMPHAMLQAGHVSPDVFPTARGCRFTPSFNGVQVNKPFAKIHPLWKSTVHFLKCFLDQSVEKSCFSFVFFSSIGFFCLFMLNGSFRVAPLARFV